MKIILLLPLLFFLSFYGLGQEDDSRSTKKNGIWTLTLPDDEDGPMVFTFNYEYWFTRECIGNEGCYVNLSFNITNIDVVPLSGRYGFRHLGKTYFADVISQYDQRGVTGFDNIEVTSFTIENLIITGGGVGMTAERFTMGTSMGSKWHAAKITNYTKLDQLGIDFTISRAKNVNYSGSSVAKERIMNYLRSQSTQNDKPSGNTSSQYNTNTSSSAPTSNSATSHDGGSSQLSEKVLVNGQYVQVYEQNGVPYMIEADGRTHETSREVYDYVMNKSNSAQSFQNTPSNPVDEPMPDFGSSNDIQALEQQRNEAVGELINTVGNVVEFYAAEAREDNAREEERRSREFDEMMANRAKEDQANTNRINFRSKRARQVFSHTIYHFNNSTDQSTQDKMHVLLTRNLISMTESFYSSETEKFYSVEIDDMLPETSEIILDKAKAVNNFDAVLLDCNCLVGIPDNTQLEKLKIIAEQGSKDAMIILGDYYDRRKVIRGIETILVGNNAEQALYWYSRAAAAGCPVGNFKLSRIYRLGSTTTDDYMRKYHVKYNIVKNDSIAYDYLCKAFSDMNYQASGWLKSLHDFNSQYMVGSSFHPELWYEYAYFIANGIYVVKDEQVAKAYTEYGDKLKTNMKSQQIPEFISARGFEEAGMYVFDNDQCEMAVEDNGYTYTIEAKQGGAWYSVLPFNLLSQDFEISYSITKIKGGDDYLFGMIVGENCVTGDQHLVATTGNGKVIIASKNLNSTTRKDLVNNSSPAIVKGNAFNGYRIRKVKDELSFYINGTLVSTTKIEQLHGNRFGFQVYSGTENFKISISNFSFTILY